MKKPPFLVLPALLVALAAPPLVAQDTPNRPDSAAPAPAEESRPADPNRSAPLHAERPDVQPSLPTALVAVLTPTEGHRTKGVVTFESLESGQVRVAARVSGLTPEAKHAMHIHEFGDISSPDGSSAGDHFNPEGKAHGLPDSEERHPGDFGNLEADAEGNANLVLTVAGLTLAEGMSSIIGRAVIVHAGEDKGTQPSGDAGDRIAQGVIAICNPDSIKDRFADTPEEGAAATTDTAASTATVPTTPTRATAPTAATKSDLAEAGEEIGEAAEQLGRGAKKAARTAVKAVERGAEEVGGALKKVGKEIEKAAE